MGQQVGSTSGTTPASPATEITPGGASDGTSESEVVAQGGTATATVAGPGEGPVGAGRRPTQTPEPTGPTGPIGPTGPTGPTAARTA